MGMNTLTERNTEAHRKTRRVIYFSTLFLLIPISCLLFLKDVDKNMDEQHVFKAREQQTSQKIRDYRIYLQANKDVLDAAVTIDASIVSGVNFLTYSEHLQQLRAAYSRLMMAHPRPDIEELQLHLNKIVALYQDAHDIWQVMGDGDDTPIVATSNGLAQIMERRPELIRHTFDGSEIDRKKGEKYLYLVAAARDLWDQAHVELDAAGKLYREADLKNSDAR